MSEPCEWDGISESPEEVIERLQQAEAQVQRVRALHAAKDCECCCAECPDGYPCPTIRILDGGDA
jgi:hypothetical protein